MAKLVFVHEKFMGQTHSLAEGKTTVGRGNQNGLVIPDSSVSVEHCVILKNASEVLISEVGSANGTYIDDKRVHGQHPVKSGQKVRFGAIDTILDLEDMDEGTESDEITAIWAHNRATHKAQAAAPLLASPAALHTDSPASPDEQTVEFKSPPLPSVSQGRGLTPPRPELPPSHSTISKLWVILGVLAIGVAVVLLLFRDRFGR
jgi:pSer/pThr/pTyr-binding forkhead associated (FHA) protein